MQQADRVRGERSRGVVENRPELLSELAGDQGSESSVSDMPVSVDFLRTVLALVRGSCVQPGKCLLLIL